MTVSYPAFGSPWATDPSLIPRLSPQAHVYEFNPTRIGFLCSQSSYTCTMGRAWEQSYQVLLGGMR